jgi:hypothetical protein
LQDADHRQRLVDSFINAIYLYDDKIVMTFNYKEGGKTVELRDIANSAASTEIVNCNERLRPTATLAARSMSRPTRKSRL